MQLERIAIRLRPRSGWEALDLGRVMVREWRGPVARAWCGVYWPVGLALLLPLWNHPGIAITILWWLKPAFDRAVLFALSRALFGTSTGFGDIWRALPGLLRGPGMLSSLTWRRFSLTRSFLLPVWQLEQQRGRAARQRFKVLNARHRGYAVWLTFCCSNLVTALVVSLVIAVELFVPQGRESFFSWSDYFKGGLEPWQQFLVNLLLMGAETLVEPLYVASGFALYLNRRSELEAWDIELAFRDMKNPAESLPPQGKTLAKAAALVLAVGLLAGAPPPAHAQTAFTADLPAKGAAPARSQAQRVIRDVLNDPVFGVKNSDYTWRHIPENKKSAPFDWTRLLDLIETLGGALRVLVWIGAVVLITSIILLIYRNRAAWLRWSDARPAPPESLFGLDVRPESLPDDVSAAALAALANGDAILALSLIYRATLAALMRQDQVEFRPGDTEDDCLRRANRIIDAARGEYFSELVQAWRLTAYARRIPAAAVLDSLCRRWDVHFSLAGARA